jgi:hypothetical protein
VTSHLGAMALFAALVSVVFATLLRDDTASQLRFGTRVFLSLVGGAYVAGWLMFLVLG